MLDEDDEARPDMRQLTRDVTVLLQEMRGVPKIFPCTDDPEEES